MSASKKRGASEPNLATVTSPPSVTESTFLCTATPVSTEEWRDQAKPAAAITKSSSSSTATAAAPSETFDNIEDMMIYCNDDRQQIRIVVHNSANLQPTVVIKYNAEWVAANPQGKALLTAFFLEHNCTDAHNTGYVFRFQRTADLVSCQEALRTAMPHLFAFSPSTTALLHLAEPTRVGELWVVYKVGKNETSCVLYREFFWK